MVTARLRLVCGLGGGNSGDESSKFIQRAMAKQTAAGWKGRMDEWLTAGKVELSDSGA